MAKKLVDGMQAIILEGLEFELENNPNKDSDFNTILTLVWEKLRKTGKETDVPPKKLVKKIGAALLLLKSAKYITVIRQPYDRVESIVCRISSNGVDRINEHREALANEALIAIATQDNTYLKKTVRMFKSIGKRTWKIIGFIFLAILTLLITDLYAHIKGLLGL